MPDITVLDISPQPSGPQPANLLAGSALPPGVRPDYNSPKELAVLLESMGFAMQKRFGQNFLVNQGARQRLFKLLALPGSDQPPPRCWEIGPGFGAMTALALDAGLDLSAFEIDHGFARFLTDVYGSLPTFRLYEGDFLATWRRARAEQPAPDCIFGNLPYNVASAMIAALLEGGLTPPRMVFTIQKEAAERMTAKPGDKDYSSFTVLCHSLYRVRKAFDLSAGMFWPQPRVVSSVVAMELRADAPSCAGDKKFTRFTRSAFAARRKTLRNNLKASGIAEAAFDAAVESLGLAPDVRAERLSVEQLASLFQLLEQAGR